VSTEQTWQDGDLKVVVNDEGQYSIWPKMAVNALGWRDAGMAGAKKECLDWIARVWVETQPGCLRERGDRNDGG
jgi:MbtH protein